VHGFGAVNDLRKIRKELKEKYPPPTVPRVSTPQSYTAMLRMLIDLFWPSLDNLQRVTPNYIYILKYCTKYTIPSRRLATLRLVGTAATVDDMSVTTLRHAANTTTYYCVSGGP
jgi:hypothetical protein